MLFEFEVLDSIKQRSGETPTPFAISKQYKNNNKKEETIKIPEDEVTPQTAAKKKKKAMAKSKVKKKESSKPIQSSEASCIGEYEPSVYAEKRKIYIDNLRETGVAFNLAASAWNLSQEKRNLLCSVSVTELKRRRFLPKGATENPWAK